MAFLEPRRLLRLCQPLSRKSSRKLGYFHSSRFLCWNLNQIQGREFHLTGPFTGLLVGRFFTCSLLQEACFDPQAGTFTAMIHSQDTVCSSPLA